MVVRTILYMTKPSKAVTVDRSPADVRAVNEAVNRVKRGANELLLGLYDFARLKGWEVTGHANFTEWAESMSDWSGSTAYRKLAQGEVLSKMMAGLGLTSGDVAGVSVPAVSSARLAALPVESFTAAAAEVRAETPAASAPQVARQVVAKLERSLPVKPDKVLSGPRVGAKFRQLTLSLDALTAEVVPDDREAVRELYMALGERLSEWGML